MSVESGTPEYNATGIPELLHMDQRYFLYSSFAEPSPGLAPLTIEHDATTTRRVAERRDERRKLCSSSSGGYT